jgi:hypothetical protein
VIEGDRVHHRRGQAAGVELYLAHRTISFNLLGSLYLARSASRLFVNRAGGGRIVNISSIIGARGCGASWDAARSRSIPWRRDICSPACPPPSAKRNAGRSSAARCPGGSATARMSDAARFITGQTSVVNAGITR